MKRLATVIASSILASTAAADCPEYLDQDMRKLHSKETVNLCASGAGKPMLLVNTASHCGYTKQLKGLEALHQKYRDQGLVIVGFASNDFRQAAKNEEEAATICYVNYGVTFTMLAPTSVKGSNANPVFRELAQQAQAPGWNFNKYLVDSSGTVVEHFDSSTRPDDATLVTAIEDVL